MSSSDEDQNADDLLSSFNPRLPPPKTPNHSTASPATTNTEITPPKRRSRPPKSPLVVINLDSDGSQTSEPARRPRERLKNSSSSVVATGPRARRSRAAIANYYSNSIYTGYVSESEEEASEEPQTSRSKPAAKSASSRSGEALSTTKNLTSKSFLVVYNARGIQIGRHAYAGFEDLPNPPRILPYSPQNKPSGYAHVFRKNPHVQLLHVSFSEAEILAIIELLSSYGIDPCLSELSVADAVTRIVRSIHKHRIDQDILKKLPLMIRLQNTLKSHGFDNLLTYSQVSDFSNHQIDDLYRKISIKRNPLAQTSHLLCKAVALSRRSVAEIQAFLEDARLGNVPSRPHYICASNEQASTARFARPTLLPYRNSKHLAEQLTFKKTHAWKGASNDVLDLAWSPDGSKFAVGAAAQCDEHNMQYNRSNNLILGDYQTKTIKELSDHRVPFPIVNHNNSHLYMSVTAVQWFDDTLYTSSYDKTVRIWDVSTYAGVTCKRVLRHAHKVHVMARSPANPTLLATGTESTLHLWHSAGCSDLDYLAQRSTKNPRVMRDADFTPSSLAWGLSPLTQDMFVAGFSGKSYHEGNACREGLLTAWKAAESSLIPIPLQPNAQNIFDVKSHPFLSCFATGSSVSAIGTNGAGKDIRSFVRVYEPLLRPRCTYELDCPALDINDVSFCPTNRNLISASCTDAITYVWDVRNPSEILHKLSHGNAINQLDEELTREQADVGVRVALWGKSTEEFITGGSDGVLRSWNILLAPEDVHIREIAVIEDEIMSGAFSPDKSSLLIGDAAGGIHILQPASSSEPVEPLHFEYKEEPATLRSHDSGRAIGRALLETGQLSQHPQYGIGKGPAYAGPYAAWARAPETPKNMLGVAPLLRDVEALQLDRGSSAVPERADHHIVEQLRKTASIRNRDPNLLKRKDSVAHRPTKKDRTGDVIDLCGDDRVAMEPAKLSRNLSKAPVIIDLTNDTDEEEDAGSYVDDSAEDDYWFPDSGVIDANIRYSE